MSIKFPLEVDTTPEDEYLYMGLSKQNLSSHQAICELIDNAISAKKDETFFIIEIHIEKIADEITLTIADNGKGIPLEDLQKRILRIGGRGSSNGVLNEHGFGLKNSLCVLTRNSKPFKIITRDKDALDNNLIYQVNGPFSKNMQINLGVEGEWLILPPISDRL